MFSLLPRSFTAIRLRTVQTASIAYQAYPQQPFNKPPRTPAEWRPLARDPIPPRTKTQAEIEEMEYLVPRTPYAQLPLYRKWKGGGTLEVVILKRVQGDKKKVVNELVQSLNLDKEEIRINPVTKHIELKVSCCSGIYGPC